MRLSDLLSKSPSFEFKQVEPFLIGKKGNCGQKSDLNIGNVVEISPQFGEQNYIIKEGLIYKGSIFEPYFKTFILNNIEVYICLLFQDNKYSKECFFE